jgi:hypothetical protein
MHTHSRGLDQRSATKSVASVREPSMVITRPSQVLIKYSPHSQTFVDRLTAHLSLKMPKCTNRVRNLPPLNVTLRDSGHSLATYMLTEGPGYYDSGKYSPVSVDIALGKCERSKLTR